MASFSYRPPQNSLPDDPLAPEGGFRGDDLLSYFLGSTQSPLVTQLPVPAQMSGTARGLTALAAALGAGMSRQIATAIPGLREVQFRDRQRQQIEARNAAALNEAEGRRYSTAVGLARDYMRDQAADDRLDKQIDANQELADAREGTPKVDRRPLDKFISALGAARRWGSRVAAGQTVEPDELEGPDGGVIRNPDAGLYVFQTDQMDAGERRVKRYAPDEIPSSVYMMWKALPDEYKEMVADDYAETMAMWGYGPDGRPLQQAAAPDTAQADTTGITQEKDQPFPGTSAAILATEPSQPQAGDISTKDFYRGAAQTPSEPAEPQEKRGIEHKGALKDVQGIMERGDIEEFDTYLLNNPNALLPEVAAQIRLLMLEKSRGQ